MFCLKVSVSHVVSSLILLALVLALLLVQVTPALAARGDTVRLSVDSSGAQADNTSYNPSISGDGRYVAFDSNASNLVDGDTNVKNDIFVRDTQLNTIVRISINSSGAQANNESAAPSISADGRYVTFYSYANDLVVGDTNGQSDIFLRDMQLNTTARISVSSSSAQANNASYNPTISADENCVVFQSAATNLAPNDTNPVMFDIFVRNISSNTTTLISLSSSGATANDHSYAPAISSNGRYVAFYSFATTLVNGDTNGKSDVFVRDTQLNTTTRISVDSSGAEANSYSDYPAISADGRYVAFVSAASNLIAGDTNGAPDIFVRDMQLNTTTRISVHSSGEEANGTSYSIPSISADGRYVAFASAASDLVNDDTNDQTDIFVYDTVEHITTRISLDTSLTQANQPSYNPSISSDGNYVSYNSIATNLVSDDTNLVSDIFIHDRTPSSDTISPNVTIEQASGQGDPTSASPINFTVVFSEPIKAATFIGADMTLGGTTVGALSAVVSEIAPFDRTTFNIAISGLSGNGTVTAALPESKVTDLVGNPNIASTSTDNSVTYIDTTPPTVSMSSTAANPINGVITVKVTFSEAVTGFTVGDITVSNGTTSNLTGGDTIYTFDLTPTVNDALVTADIAAGAAQDPALNNNTAATQFTRLYDGAAPTTTIDSQPPAQDVNTTPTFSFSGHDGAGTGVAFLMCKMDAGDYAICASPFTSPALANGTHTFSVYAVDNASNADASPASYTWVVDTIPPIVVSSNCSNPNPTSRANTGFAITFSESVTGVDITDFRLTTTGVNGASITSVSGSGAAYTVTVNTGSGNGTIRLDVLDNNSILDGASNPLNGAFSSGQIYTIKKTLTFNSNGAQDGWILESSENSSRGGSINVTSTTLQLGNNAAKRQYLSILSFGTGANLPDNAVITTIILKIKKSSVSGGGNPVNTFGGFMVDIKKGFFGTAPTLQTGDFQITASKSYGPFKPALVSGWYSINLTTGKGYINKLAASSGLTQIRLRFKLDDNNKAVANYLSLYSGNAPLASRPQLIITYYTP